MAWNEFQETLGQLYSVMFEQHAGLAVASWQALENDRAQREMLRAVARYALGPNSKAYSEIGWLIEQANQQLSNQRNFGIHTPLMVFSENNGPAQILPLTIFGNRRAIALEGKDILAEYGHYADQINKMVTFALMIRYNIQANRPGPESWSERPQLQFRAPNPNPTE
jgi:hypothetical protein